MFPASKTDKNDKTDKAALEKKGKSPEEDDDARVDSAFKSFRSLAEKHVLEAASPKDEPYYPSVSVEFEGELEQKVGSVQTVIFQAEVESVTKTKTGSRVCYRLKGIKE